MWPFKAKAKNTTRARDKPATTTRWYPVHRVRADSTMRGNEAIYAAVSRIANALASMPLHLYKGYELAVDHPVERLVGYAPSENCSPFAFKQTMEAFRNTEGNAYALIVEKPLGNIVRLDILDPTRVKPQRHPVSGEMWYAVMLDDGKYRLLPGCQLIALRHMSANGEIGVRPIDVLAGSLDYDKQVKEFSLQQLDGVNQGVFVTVPNTGLGQTERQKVIDDFLNAYEQSGGRVVILEGGLTATTFSQNPINAQVLDVERITRNRVATVYNIPPHLLGDYTDTSYSTAEQQMQEFMKLTLLPIVQQWEEELNRKLLTYAEYKNGYRFRFDTEAMNRADTATMAEKHQKAIRGGWMLPNEVRQREGLPPDPNGNELLASRDLLPLRIAMNNPELLLSSRYDGGADDKEAGGEKT